MNISRWKNIKASTQNVASTGVHARFFGIRQAGTEQDEYANCVAAAEDNTLIVGGYTMGDFYDWNAGSGDLFVSKLDDQGSALWSMQVSCVELFSCRSHAVILLFSFLVVNSSWQCGGRFQSFFGPLEGTCFVVCGMPFRVVHGSRGSWLQRPSIVNRKQISA